MCTQYLKLTIILFPLSFFLVQAFNLSPAPNIIYKIPVTAGSRSSYFGYSIVLSAENIIIGAPRDKSSLPEQSNINETGVIYKCGLSSQTCHNFFFTNIGNVKSEDYLSCSIRDYQFLGASMDGGPRDADIFLACAPRFVGACDQDEKEYYEKEHYLHGVCYWAEKTSEAQPTKAQKFVINPLTDASRQDRENENAESKEESIPYYKLGELGFSSHITPTNEFLMGAPGILSWRGSVVRFNKTTNEFKVPQITKTDGAYAGYAISSGYLDSNNPQKLLYVVTVPHADSTLNLGEAHIFDFGEEEEPITKFATLNGTQYGDFFGYAVVVADINGDRLDDVLITAPLHGYFDEGAVYVFENKGNLTFDRKIVKSPFAAEARFGTAITNLGDINSDGYKDIAIGAPFAYGNGAVAVYLGSAAGLEARPSQTVNLTYNGARKVPANSMFGHSLSKGVDIDDNGFNDLAIGAPNAEEVFVHNTYPVVKINASIQFEKQRVGLKDDVLKIKICAAIIRRPASLNQTIVTRLKLDPKLRRLYYRRPNETEISKNFTADECSPFEVYVISAPKYVYAPFSLELYYELRCPADIGEQAFIKTCAMVDPRDPNVTRTSIGYMHCRSYVCNVDLVVEKLSVETYIDIVRVVFKISNKGEKAFNVQANVTSSVNLPFSRIPHHCSEQNDKKLRLVCGMTNNNKPLTESVELEVFFDKTDRAELEEVTVTAVVSASGNEMADGNNEVVFRHLFPRYAVLDMKGTPEKKYIPLESLESKMNLTYKYALQNRGPHMVRDLKLLLSLPTTYKNASTNHSMEFIKTSGTFAVAYLNGHQHAEMLFEDTENDGYIENNVSVVNFADLQGLPGDRTLVSSCQAPGFLKCFTAHLVFDFAPGDNLTIEVRYQLHKRVMKKLLNHFDFFGFWFQLTASSNSSEISLEKSVEPCIIVNLKAPKLSPWIYGASTVAGFVVLIALTAVLHKMGFFRRPTREALAKLIHQQKKLSRGNAEAANA